MPNTNRFFIIRSDGTSSTVTGEQLNTMRLNGFVGPDDKVVPIPNQTVLNNLVVQPSEFNPISTALNQVEPATDDLDTAPLSPHLLLLDKNNEKPSSHRFDNIEDFEIDLAFSTATSQSLYQMNAEEADLALPLAKDNLVQDTTQIPAKDKTLYNILFSDGRVLGPFDEQNIWERFSQSMLSGNEQIALAGSENYKPILDYIEFRAAFKTFNEKDFNKAKTHTIDMASIAPFLLQLSHDLATGWLIVKHETQTYVLSFAVGRIIHIRSNQPTQNQPDNMLKPIFSLESGIAWFETDPFVASDERMVFQDVLSLSRQLTNVKNGFSLSRILQTIGDQNRTLQLKSANQWKTSVDQLITLEKSVLTPAEQGKTTHETLRSLIALKYSEEDCLHALFMVIIAGCISTIEESITLEIKEFTHKLFSSHFVDLLPLSSSSEDNFVFKELETLKNRIANTAKLLPQKDPLIKEMEDRFHYIKQLILNKTERYVLFKAFEENIDLEKKPDQAFALKRILRKSSS